MSSSHLNTNDDDIEEGLAVSSTSGRSRGDAGRDPPTATMAESLGIEALDSERCAAATVIETIDDVAASAVFNAMKFDDENKPKRAYAAAARAKVETTDGDVNVAGNQRSGKGYLDEDEEENLVNHHDQAVTNAANDSAEPLPLVNHMTVPEALLGHQVHVDEEEEDNLVDQPTVTTNAAEPVPLLTVPTACLVDEEEVVVATHVQVYRPWWKEQRTQLLFGSSCVLAAALAITLGVTLGTSTPDEQKLSSEANNSPPAPIDAGNGTMSLEDFAPCSSSSECKKECCSGMYSSGVLVCTPLDEPLLLGGYKPDVCVGDPATPWAQCLTSSECDSGCCSGHFTGGQRTCVPVANEELAHICISPDTNCTPGYLCRGDWVPCSSSSECNNGCCTGTNSGGVLKCTPDPANYTSDICIDYGIDASEVTPTPTVACNSTSCLDDWVQCSSSSQCETGCCSGNFTGGVLRCTPTWFFGHTPDMCTAV
jgi:hypothetical protein